MICQARRSVSVSDATSQCSRCRPCTFTCNKPRDNHLTPFPTRAGRPPSCLEQRYAFVKRMHVASLRASRRTRFNATGIGARRRSSGPSPRTQGAVAEKRSWFMRHVRKADKGVTSAGRGQGLTLTSATLRAWASSMATTAAPKAPLPRSVSESRALALTLRRETGRLKSPPGCDKQT